MSAVSTHIAESAVVAAPLTRTWSVISALDFSWWSLVDRCELQHGASPLSLDAHLALYFKDGHSWVIAIRELSSIHHSVTFEVVDASPSSLVSSAIHTISLKKVSCSHQTYVEWVSDFSSDASAEVVVDS